MGEVVEHAIFHIRRLIFSFIVDNRATLRPFEVLGSHSTICFFLDLFINTAESKKSSFYASHLARGARALHGARAIDRGHTDRERERERERGAQGPGAQGPGTQPLSLSIGRAVQRSCTAGQVTSVKARLLRYCV